MRVVGSKYDGAETFEMPLMKGDLIMHFPFGPLACEFSRPADFWLLERPAELTITSKFSDLPPWFTLHPTEMGGELARAMLQKHHGRPPSGDLVRAPNVWTVKEGDRIAMFCERPWTNPEENGWVIEIGENCLVYWQLMDGGPPGVLEAFGAPPEDDDEKRQRWTRRALASVQAGGLPRTCSTEWRISRL